MAPNESGAPATTLDQADGPPRAWVLWTGRVLSAVPTLMLVMSAAMKLVGNPQMLEQASKQFGYPASSFVGLGVIELASAVLYAVPRTTVLGAILVTGYLGGAIATHVRVGEVGGAVVPFLLGVIAWLGIYLRDKRLRAILPVRSKA
jgi:hypothetical protein